jgi:hypothetical protein
MPPEIQFLASPSGGALVVIVALAAFALVIAWAWRPGRPDRRAAVYAAGATSLLVAVVTVIAVIAGWWQGAYFALPLVVLAAIHLPFSIAGYTAWLGTYRWLAGRTRHAFAIYTAVVLCFIPVIILVDPIQMQRGQFSMGNGYTIWSDAALGQLVMWSPVLAYEAIRHWRGARRTGRTAA